MINEPASSEIGLSGYAVLRALGKGGVGEVVLAHQVALNREVAIKRIRRGRSGDAKALARLKTEQIMGSDVDGRVDVYALGCVLYQCLTGIPPFQKDNDAAVIYAHLQEPPPTLANERPELPVEIGAVITRAMAKSREDRYPTAGVLCSAARAALASDILSSPSASARAPGETRVAKPPRRKPAPTVGKAASQPLNAEKATLTDNGSP